MRNASAYTAAINAACEGIAASGSSVRLHHVHDHLHQIADTSPDDAAWKHLAEACAYSLGVPLTADSGGPYAPELELRDGEQWLIYPPHLATHDNSVLATWQLCAADDALWPLVRARLADLLWVRKASQPPLWHKIAVDSYRAAASDPQLEMVDSEEGLRRAVRIATESNQDTGDALTALADLAEEALARGGLFGVVARALQVLVDNEYPCAQLLDDAAQQHDSDPHECNIVLLLKRQASQSIDDQRILDHQRVQAFAGAADAAVGLLRLAHLEQARSIAREAGLNQEAERLSGLMERTSLEGDLQRVEASVKIDKQAVDDFIADTLGCGGFADALRRLGRTQMVADPNQATEAVAAAAQAAPLMSLCTVLSVGDGGAVTEIPSGTSERLDYELGHHAAMSIQMYTHLFGKPVLDALQRQHNPTAEAIANHFASTGIPGHLARRVGSSYTHWASGDFESAVSVLWPVLEPAVRGVCSAAGITTTETRVRSSGKLPTGGVRALRPLLDELGAQLPPAMSRYLVAVLVDIHALNLRNRLAHGLVDELDEALYVVLFHAACVLAAVSEAVGAP